MPEPAAVEDARVELDGGAAAVAAERVSAVDATLVAVATASVMELDAILAAAAAARRSALDGIPAAAVAAARRSALDTVLATSAAAVRGVAARDAAPAADGRDGVVEVETAASEQWSTLTCCLNMLSVQNVRQQRVHE